MLSAVPSAIPSVRRFAREAEIQNAGTVEFAVSMIVAARFATFAEAESVARTLLQRGFQAMDITSFFVNPAGQHSLYPIGGDKFANRGTRESRKGAIVAAVLGAVAGAALGALLFAIFDIPAILVIGLSLVGAYGGSLMGALGSTGDAAGNVSGKHRDVYPGNPSVTPSAAGTATRPVVRPEDAHPSGVMVAVRVTPATVELARRVLSENGGQDVERAEGEWRNGTWTDFDPLKVPRSTPPAT